MFAFEEEEQELFWSIDDDTLFYPLGLINHRIDSKSVFVTWSEKYLMNFVFKISAKSEQSKLTKVRLDVHSERICKILILQLNTLLLMQSGRVFHFSSMKSMHPVRWLSGVRCISAARDGFSIVRVADDNEQMKLLLEVYQDVVNIDRSKNTPLHSFDITFDDVNLFNCSWQDETYTILSEEVSSENKEFLKNLIGKDTKLDEKQEVHFFTVSGNIFTLIQESEGNASSLTDYCINLFASYASNVEFIKILCKSKMCIIYLQCGVLEVLYMSQLSGQLEKTTHYTGSHIVYHEFNIANECFHYTDGEKVVQLKLVYDRKSDMCLFQERSKAVQGILACTWMESIQQLICLSCNNIFYHLTFHESDEVSLANDETDELQELTSIKMSQLMETVHFVNDLNVRSAQIRNEIEKENVKQVLLNVQEKSEFYRRIFEARLEFRLHLLQPWEEQEDLITIYTKSNYEFSINSLFALIFLKSTDIEILKCTLWNLHITYDHSCHIFSLPCDILRKQLCIVVPLIRSTDHLLPNFHISLNTFVNIQHDFMAISLPIALSKKNCYKHLFTLKARCLELSTETSISQLMAKWTGKRPKDGQDVQLECKLALQSHNFIDVLELFNKEKGEKDTLYIYFMSICVNVIHLAEENCIILKCSDAGALFYTKYWIMENLSGMWVPLDKAESDERKKCIMRLQAELIHYSDTIWIDEQNVDAMQRDNLLRIYTKLRNITSAT